MYDDGGFCGVRREGEFMNRKKRARLRKQELKRQAELARKGGAGAGGRDVDDAVFSRHAAQSHTAQPSPVSAAKGPKAKGSQAPAHKKAKTAPSKKAKKRAAAAKDSATRGAAKVQRVGTQPKAKPPARRASSTLLQGFGAFISKADS